MPDVAASYADRSVIARLVAALVTVQRWQKRAHVGDPAVDTFAEVLWRFPLVGGPSFGPWHQTWDADPLRRELDDADHGEPVEVIIRVQQAAKREHASPAPLLSGLLHASEILGGNLFKAVDDARTLEHLAAIEALMTGSGIALPAASEFADQPFSDFHGWGHPVDDDTVARWRALV